MTVDMNDEFGSQDWNSDWENVRDTLHKTANMADTLKNVDWQDMDKDSLDASTMASVLTDLGDLTVSMNDAYGQNGERWSKEWQRTHTILNSSASVADKLKAVDWMNRYDKGEKINAENWN